MPQRGAANSVGGLRGTRHVVALTRDMRRERRLRGHVFPSCNSRVYAPYGASGNVATVNVGTCQCTLFIYPTYIPLLSSIVPLCSSSSSLLSHHIDIFSPFFLSLLSLPIPPTLSDPSTVSPHSSFLFLSRSHLLPATERYHHVRRS